MDFKETFLPDNQVVRDAFDFTYGFLQSKKVALMRAGEAELRAQHTFDLEDLQRDYDEGVIDDPEKETIFEEEKQGIHQQLSDGLEQLSRSAQVNIENMMWVDFVYPALEVALHTDSGTPDVVAATLLAAYMRSPVDYINARQKFGDKIANLAAEVCHIESYPARREKNIAAASPDAKRICLAFSVAEADVFSARHALAVKTKPEIALQLRQYLPLEKAERISKDIEMMWGTDKKFDKYLVTVFNRVSDVVAADSRMSIDDDGNLTRIRGNLASALTKPDDLDTDKKNFIYGTRIF